MENSTKCVDKYGSLQLHPPAEDSLLTSLIILLLINNIKILLIYFIFVHVAFTSLIYKANTNFSFEYFIYYLFISIWNLTTSQKKVKL